MKTVEITCTGYSVKADWYEGRDTSKILLVLYGSGSKKSNQVELVSGIVAATGMSALVPDYSGCGDDGFDRNEIRPAQNFLEVINAFDWLKDQYPEAEIAVMGTSYGGFLATQLTKYRMFRKLVLRAPAIYKPSEFYTKWKDINDRGAIRKDTEALATHPLLARASSFSGDVLVVVHSEDEFIPVETTDAFIKTFSADSYVAEGFWHSLADPRNPREKYETYQAAISDWLRG